MFLKRARQILNQERTGRNRCLHLAFYRILPTKRSDFLLRGTRITLRRSKITFRFTKIDVIRYSVTELVKFVPH